MGFIRHHPGAQRTCALIGQRDNISFRAAGEIIREHDNTSKANRHAMMRHVKEVLHKSTPVGRLLRKVDLPLTDGTLFPWLVANPAALLYTLCSNSAHYAHFCQQLLGQGESRISIYSDEATPGQCLRPDAANILKQQCVYWTFMEWPYWFRSRGCGWLPFGYLKLR